MCLETCHVNATLIFQNAMSPAEITQQLGLQSLTRRAWVSSLTASPSIIY